MGLAEDKKALEEAHAARDAAKKKADGRAFGSKGKADDKGKGKGDDKGGWQRGKANDTKGKGKGATGSTQSVDSRPQAATQAAPKKTPAKPERPLNSLFSQLYPQSDADELEKLQRYHKAFGTGDSDDEDRPLASDEAMKGAFAALKFMSGGSSGSSSGAGGANGQAASGSTGAAASASEDPEALKRKLLEALGGDLLGDSAGGGSADGAFREGAVVEVHGLKGAPELNGRRGKLQHLDAAAGRWQVEVNGAGPKKLKPENLRWPVDTAATPNLSSLLREDPSKKARTETDKTTTFL